LPALIFAATDGYAESYKSDHDLTEIGRNYLAVVRNQGFDKVEHRLASLLDQASCSGTGDDITIGLISRFDCENVTDFDTDYSVARGGSSSR